MKHPKCSLCGAPLALIEQFTLTEEDLRELPVGRPFPTVTGDWEMRACPKGHDVRFLRLD
jgi:hypothetical protein